MQWQLHLWQGNFFPIFPPTQGFCSLLGPENSNCLGATRLGVCWICNFIESRPPAWLCLPQLRTTFAFPLEGGKPAISRSFGDIVFIETVYYNSERFVTTQPFLFPCMQDFIRFFPINLSIWSSDICIVTPEKAHYQVHCTWLKLIDKCQCTGGAPTRCNV